MNGQEERAIGVLKNCVHSFLRAANLPSKFWDSALADCVDKLNVIPKSGKTQTPYERLIGELTHNSSNSFHLVRLVTLRTLQDQKAL